MTCPASTRRRATSWSSSEGSGLPDGWLCATKIEAALSIIAAEDLTRMDEAAVHDFDSDDADGRDSVPAVKSESKEMLSSACPVAFQNLVGVCGGADGDFVFDSFLRELISILSI